MDDSMTDSDVDHGGGAETSEPVQAFDDSVSDDYGDGGRVQDGIDAHSDEPPNAEEFQEWEEEFGIDESEVEEGEAGGEEEPGEAAKPEVTDSGPSGNQYAAGEVSPSEFGH